MEPQMNADERRLKICNFNSPISYLRLSAFICGSILFCSLLSAREFSIDLWDWTPPCRDLPTFTRWAADMKSIGATRVEISAPWNLLEPEPNRYDFSFIADRYAVA